jgi:hypothetical protein
MASIVGGMDIHRKQVTFDYLDLVTGEVKCGQIAPADRASLRAWLTRHSPAAGPRQIPSAHSPWPARSSPPAPSLLSSANYLQGRPMRPSCPEVTPLFLQSRFRRSAWLEQAAGYADPRVVFFGLDTFTVPGGSRQAIVPVALPCGG